MSSQGNKIQRYDNFTKLEQVVLGRINFDLLQLIGDTDQKNYVEHQFHNAADTLEQINDIFKKFDIKVYRPEPLPYTPDLTTPYATLPAVNNVLCPFDNYLILENTTFGGNLVTLQTSGSVPHGHHTIPISKMKNVYLMRLVLNQSVIPFFTQNIPV